jgi:hypothetical protein
MHGLLPYFRAVGFYNLNIVVSLYGGEGKK